jgi:hypothetical protein
MQILFNPAESQLKAQIEHTGLAAVTCRVAFKDDLYQPRM